MEYEYPYLSIIRKMFSCPSHHIDWLTIFPKASSDKGKPVEKHSLEPTGVDFGADSPT